MLASILPGLRDLRTPLATGYLWLLVIWLTFGQSRLVPEDPDNLFASRLQDLASLVGPAATLAAVSFAAYLLGSILTADLSLVLGLTESADEVYPWPQRWILPESLVTNQSIRADVLSDWLHATVQIDTAVAAWIASNQGAETGLPSSVRQALVSEAERGSGRDSAREVLLDGLAESIEYLEPELVTQLRQTENEQVFQDFDRLEAEVKLRFSLLIPLVLLVILGVILLWPWWLKLVALAGLLLPIRLYRQGMFLLEESRLVVTSALVSGRIQSPTVNRTIEALRKIESDRPWKSS